MKKAGYIKCLFSSAEQAYQMNEKKIAKERGSATKRSKNMRLKTTGVPDELWKNYPELIILGPDQMEAIKCKKNKVALTGEPGCGKTFVLLALLFIHTAKCRDKLQFPGFKKTCFVIPDRKIEFRKYVSSFITDHCNEESVALVKSVDEIDTKAEIFLLDEIPFYDQNAIGTINRLSKRHLRIYWAITMSRYEFHYPRNLVDWDEWAFFSFRCAYRCPSNVSKRYSKLRRYLSNFTHGNLFRASIDNTVHVFDDREFKVVPYSKTIDLYNIIQDLPGKELEKESLLLVIDDQAFTWIDCSPIIEKLRSKFYSSFVYTNRHEDGFKRCPFKELPFTGVQYHTVIIIMIPKEGGTYYDYSEVLYHAVSRTLRRALII